METISTRDAAATPVARRRPAMVQTEVAASSDSTARTGVTRWIYRASVTGAVVEGLRRDGSVAARFDFLRLAAGKFALDGRVYAADGRAISYNLPALDGATPTFPTPPDAAFAPFRESLLFDVRSLTSNRSILPPAGADYGGGPLIDGPILDGGGLLGGGLTGGDLPPSELNADNPAPQSECDKATQDAAIAAINAVAAGLAVVGTCVVPGPACTAAVVAYGAALSALSAAYQRELIACL